MANKKITKQTFQWKITAKKILKNSVIVVIAGLTAVYGNNPFYLALSPLIIGIENWLKHK